MKNSDQRKNHDKGLYDLNADLRFGRVTSSMVFNLMGFDSTRKKPGAPFYSYVEDKRLERWLGIGLDVETYSRPASWGSIMERYVFERKIMGFDYFHVAAETRSHPKISGWVGTPDLIAETKVGDIKCYYPKNFAHTAKAIILAKEAGPEMLKRLAPQEYWQLLSNCAITGLPNAELFLFLPKEDEVDDIRDFVANIDDADQWKYRWIFESELREIPHLPNNSQADSLYSYEFVAPPEDLAFLTARVGMALELINL